MARHRKPQREAEGTPALHSARWRFADFALDEGRRELTREGTVVHLEPKPLNMLMLMLRHPGELITKSDLIEALWTGRIVTDSVLTNCVRKLRTALGEDDPRIALRTVHGYGFRLDAEPELMDAGATVVPPKVEFEPLAAIPARPSWRLVRRLGYSGDCWLGEMPASGARRVFKFAHSPSALASLKREVTIHRLLQQSLDAPPIVPILDWNLDEPPWFIELEHCADGSLQEHLDARGGAAAVPFDERLALVIELAEALAAVHSVGVLHKDIKPSNVLIAGDARAHRVLLADFGAGRVLDPTRLEAMAITRLGLSQLEATAGGSSTSSGTPLYYAPEMLRGQPPTLKSDVYSLGVILYQLAVGDLRRLFTPGWEQDLEDALLREDIAAACAADPDKRLADAGQLATRLATLPARRLAREAEQAAARRAEANALALHRAEARRSMLLVAVALLVIGLASSSWLYWQARQARQAADRSAQQAVASRDFVLQDVLGRLGSADEAAQRLTVRDLLNTASAQVGERFKNQPELEAMVRYQLGLSQENLQMREEASQQFFAALEKSATLKQSDPKAYVDLVNVLLINEYNLNRFEQREAELLKLHESCKALVPADYPGLLSQYRVLAMVADNAGDYPRAQTLIDTAAAAADKLPVAGAKTAVHIRLLQGRIQFSNGAYILAAQTLRQVLAQARSVFGEDHRATFGALVRLAQVEAQRGEHAEASRLLAEAAKIAMKWEPEPAEMTLEVQGIAVDNSLQSGDLPTARKAMAVLDRLIGEAGPRIATEAAFSRDQQRARLALDEERWQESLVWATKCEADEVARRASGLIWPVLRQTKARALLELGQVEEARQLVEEIETRELRLLPSTHPLRASQLALRGQLARADQREADAKNYFLQAAKLCEQSLSPAHRLCRQWRR